jgi:hypothetical protein
MARGLAVVVLAAAPALEAWDRIIRASLAVPPGTYQVFVCAGGPDSVQDERAPAGGDHYQIVVWPGSVMELAVLKG